MSEATAATNSTQARMYDLARHDREMSIRLYSWGDRFHSVNDPIEAEIYRIRCELYCALAAGVEDVEAVFTAHYDRARAACERFNAKQEVLLLKKSWHPTTTGYFSIDEAWQRLRHAIGMHKQMSECEQPRQDHNALLTLVREWAKYQYYPGNDALPTTEAFSAWYRRGVELTEQLCRIGGVEPPKSEGSDGNT